MGSNEAQIAKSNVYFNQIDNRSEGEVNGNDKEETKE